MRNKGWLILVGLMVAMLIFFNYGCVFYESKQNASIQQNNSLRVKTKDYYSIIRKAILYPTSFNTYSLCMNFSQGAFSFSRAIHDGTKLPFALVEFYYKDDELHDPLINDEHALILELAQEVELEELKRLGRQINVILKAFFDKRDLILVDFKLEFGKDKDGKIILADEISPDSCRFWDKNSGEKLDKDRFREGIGGIKVAYEEVRNRIKNKMLGEK